MAQEITPTTPLTETPSTGDAPTPLSTDVDARIAELEARLETVAANNKQLSTEKKETADNLKAMKSAETKRLKEAQAVEDKELEAKGDWEARLASQAKQHQAALDELTGKNDGTAAALHKAIVENSVIQAATEAQAVSPAQIMAIFGGLFTMNDAMTEAVINVEACKDAGFDPYDAGKPKNIKALMADLAKDERNLNLFKPTLPHGGAGSTQPVNQTTDVTALSPEAFALLSVEDQKKHLGALYKKYGTTGGAG